MYQKVSDLRKAGFRVKLTRDGLTGTARDQTGQIFRIDRDPVRGWLFTSYGMSTRGDALSVSA